MQVNEEAQIHIYTIFISSWLRTLSRTYFAVLSLDKLCEEQGYTYEWTSGHKPHLTKKWEKYPQHNWELRSFGGHLDCRVPARAPPQQSLPQYYSLYQELRELRELATRKLLETTAREFREPRERRNASSRKQFSRLRFGTSYESRIKIQEIQIFLLTYEKTKIARSAVAPRLWGLFAERRTGRSGTSSRKVG